MAQVTTREHEQQSIKSTNQIHLATPDKYHYGKWFELGDNTKRIEFSVKASNDAHIALGWDTLHGGRHWEIVIGGWLNYQSVIRKEGRAVAILRHRPLSD